MNLEVWNLGRRGAGNRYPSKYKLSQIAKRLALELLRFIPGMSSSFAGVKVVIMGTIGMGWQRLRTPFRLLCYDDEELILVTKDYRCREGPGLFFFFFLEFKIFV